MSWFGHLLFNWIGDHGWIEYQNVQLREPILIGDTSWLKGRVVRKYVEDGRHLVEKLHIGAEELSAVDLTRVYVPTDEAAPRQTPTND